MSLKSLKRHFGWLMIDHSASPGIPADVARQIGINPDLVAEGVITEMHTLSCSHCGTHVALNPDRTRERGYCKFCDHYICDVCDFLRSLPAYVHRTREQAAIPASNPVSIYVP
jgi:hypothetical protein